MPDQSCPFPVNAPNLLHIEVVSLNPAQGVKDFREAMALAKEQAGKRFEEYMLASWYDRDRDFESPAHATETPGDEKNGYIHYGINHGARLKVDIEEGRFVFFFTPVEWE